MAKVVQLNGHRPGGWAKDRWDWIKRVRRSGDLSTMSRLVAHSLAVGYANAETGECRPGAKALADDCATTVRTIERALRELEEAGWLVRLGGEAPGQMAAIRFSFPGERPTILTGERPTILTGDSDQRPTDLTPTPDNPDAPPRPPYKEEPNLKHNGRPYSQGATRIYVERRPVARSMLVEFGSPQEAAWEVWVRSKGLGELREIGAQSRQGPLVGWDMPSRWPPSDRDQDATRAAVEFVNWLRSKKK